MLWMSLIFLMSTGTGDAPNTSRIVEPILRYLFHNISDIDIQLIHKVIRKLAHVVEYFVLGLLLFRAYRDGTQAGIKWKWVTYSILVVLLFAAADEYHQSFVITRSASISDVGLDLLGGFLAQLAILSRSRIPALIRGK
ncbi:MAG: VanZ family protein [Ignavibacteriales bacterium]|nr:VanZ family protein [Ignavibacteriales bacterium]